MDTARQSVDTLRPIRESRLRQLGRVGPFAAASLSLTAVRCKGTGCRCRVRDQKHPAWHLQWVRPDGKQRKTYVRAKKVREVQQWIRRYSRVKLLIREISDLSVQILRAEARQERQRHQGTGT